MKWVLIKTGLVANIIVPPSNLDIPYLEYLQANFDAILEVPDDTKVEITYGYKDGQLIPPLDDPNQ